MIRTFVEAWDKYNDKLRAALSVDEKLNDCKYDYLLCALLEHVINPHMRDIGADEFEVQEISTVDDGDYQGTLIFFCYEKKYQPYVTDYIFTSVNYGSCGTCDILLGIQEELLLFMKTPTEEQLNDYMMLCLHLLQNCHYLIPRENTEIE